MVIHSLRSVQHAGGLRFIPLTLRAGNSRFEGGNHACWPRSLRWLNSESRFLSTWGSPLNLCSLQMLSGLGQSREFCSQRAEAGHDSVGRSGLSQSKPTVLRKVIARAMTTGARPGRSLTGWCRRCFHPGATAPMQPPCADHCGSCTNSIMYS